MDGRLRRVWCSSSGCAHAPGAAPLHRLAAEACLPLRVFPACHALAQEELQQQRKTLRVALGPSQPPPQQQAAAAGSKPQAPAAGQQQQQQQQQLQQQQHANGSGGGGSLADTVKSNPVISKYFQVGGPRAA